MHDIENQFVFKSNPGFIFHDSQGFEAGSLDEMQTVKSFITMRARTNELSEQLHAIWCAAYFLPRWYHLFDERKNRYCFSTDTNRPVPDADKKFFQECSNRKGILYQSSSCSNTDPCHTTLKYLSSRSSPNSMVSLPRHSASYGKRII